MILYTSAIGEVSLDDSWVVGLFAHIHGQRVDFTSFFFDIIQKLKQHGVPDFIMTLWCIWKRRNEKVWENAEKDVRILVQLVRDSFGAMREERSMNDGPCVNKSNGNGIWLSPSAGKVKYNVDIALFKENYRFGVGMCIRDYKGHFIKARTT
jgi:hypothetical protein